MRTCEQFPLVKQKTREFEAVFDYMQQYFMTAMTHSSCSMPSLHHSPCNRTIQFEQLMEICHRKHRFFTDPLPHRDKHRSQSLEAGHIEQFTSTRWHLQYMLDPSTGEQTVSLKAAASVTPLEARCLGEANLERLHLEHDAL